MSKKHTKIHHHKDESIISSQTHAYTTRSSNSLKAFNNRRIQSQKEKLDFVFRTPNNRSTVPSKNIAITNLVTLKLQLYFTGGSST